VRIPAALLASLIVSCGAPPALPAPATVPAAKQIAILASEGGVLRPIANGGRVALRGGWATVTLAPAAGGEADLDIALFDSAGRTVTGDVRASYESMDMDHGSTVEPGVLHGDCYRVRLSFIMPGAWRVVVHVAHDGVEESLTLVLPQAGL